VVVTLYTRGGCHLCETARDVIVAERARTPFAFEEIDVDATDDLVMEFGLRVPVVAIDGVERFEIEVDPVAFAGFVRA
jgi:glutaredoxin